MTRYRVRVVWRNGDQTVTQFVPTSDEADAMGHALLAVESVASVSIEKVEIELPEAAEEAA